MNSYIAVTFHHLDRDPSIESAIHRWVARFEAMRVEVQHAAATVERVGRRRIAVRVSLALTNGASQTAAVAHEDAYTAVSDAFGLVRRRLLDARSVRAGRASQRLAA